MTMSRHPTKTQGLTARQRDVLKFVNRFMRAFNKAPTRLEIGTALGFSRPVAEQHLQALKSAKCVRLQTRWRGIEVTARGAIHG